jgi:hypothetical protein
LPAMTSLRVAGIRERKCRAWESSEGAPTLVRSPQWRRMSMGG